MNTQEIVDKFLNERCYSIETEENIQLMKRIYPTYSGRYGVERTPLIELFASEIEAAERRGAQKAVVELYQLAKSEVNEAAMDNVPIKVKQMATIEIYAMRNNIDLLPDGLTLDNK